MTHEQSQPPAPVADTQLVELFASQMTVVHLYVVLVRAGAARVVPAEGLVGPVRDAVLDRAGRRRLYLPGRTWSRWRAVAAAGHRLGGGGPPLRPGHGDIRG